MRHRRPRKLRAKHDCLFATRKLSANFKRFALMLASVADIYCDRITAVYIILFSAAQFYFKIFVVHLDDDAGVLTTSVAYAVSVCLEALRVCCFSPLILFFLFFK